MSRVSPLAQIAIDIARQHREATKRMANMTHFTLMDMPTLVFRVVHRFDGLGGTVPCVTGHTLDGKRQTTARLLDVVDHTNAVRLT